MARTHPAGALDVGFASALAVLLAVSGAGPARARVKDYQVARLLLFKSECKVDTLHDESGPTGPLRYLAVCENLTFFPDGVEVRCDDRDDERSCVILTRPLRFDKLDLLRQPEAAPQP